MKKLLFILLFFFPASFLSAESLTFRGLVLKLYETFMGQIIYLIVSAVMIFFVYGIFTYIFSQSTEKKEVKGKIF